LGYPQLSPSEEAMTGAIAIWVFTSLEVRRYFHRQPVISRGLEANMRLNSRV
jgi:hypothetical protein